MQQIRHMLRLARAGVSAREIGRRLGSARSPVQDNLSRAAAAGLVWPLGDDVTDADLEGRLFRQAGVKQSVRRRAEPDWPSLLRGMRRPGVILQLLGGEDTAASLGIDVRRLRFAIFAIAAPTTASLVALEGTIGFVGSMLPPLARGLVGVRHGVLLITAALLGSGLLLAGDLASQIVLAPQELPLGVVTAAAGGLFVLIMVVRG